MSVSLRNDELHETDHGIALSDTGTQDYSPYFTVQPGMALPSASHVNHLTVAPTSSYRIPFLAGRRDQD